ncbi:MAG: LuxR C-terminal-related transcriptional regulator [Thermomicrobiales bacterium]
MDTTAAVRAQRDILRLCHAGLDAQALRLALLKALRQVTPIAAFWAATVDPDTLLFTGSVIEGIPEQATPAFLANEFLQDDANKFVALARGGTPVNSLSAATGENLEQSARYRDILAPLGLGDELRAALLSDGACWGVLCLHRQRGDPDFAADDVAFLRELAPHVAEGLRTALLLERAELAPAADGPGVILLADDATVIATTPAAAGWLAELGDWPRRDEAPQAVRAVAARLWALEREGVPGGGLLPRGRVRTRAGRWATLHAARLAGPGAGGATAVVVEPAPPVEIVPLVLRAYALTARETLVAQLVLHGRSTAEIAATLCISALTVQDHLKAIFAKTGVNNRRSLVAHVFARQH